MTTELPSLLNDIPSPAAMLKKRNTPAPVTSLNTAKDVGVGGSIGIAPVIVPTKSLSILTSPFGPVVSVMPAPPVILLKTNVPAL